MPRTAPHIPAAKPLNFAYIHAAMKTHDTFIARVTCQGIRWAGQWYGGHSATLMSHLGQRVEVQIISGDDTRLGVFDLDGRFLGMMPLSPRIPFSTSREELNEGFRRLLQQLGDSRKSLRAAVTSVIVISALCHSSVAAPIVNFTPSLTASRVQRTTAPFLTTPTLFNDVVNRGALRFSICRFSGENAMPRVDSYIDAATDGQRANHPFDTKRAAEALEVHPNRVGDWADRTEKKLTALARQQPAAVAAFCLRVMARAHSGQEDAR